MLLLVVVQNCLDLHEEHRWSVQSPSMKIPHHLGDVGQKMGDPDFTKGKRFCGSSTPLPRASGLRQEQRGILWYNAS